MTFIKNCSPWTIFVIVLISTFASMQAQGQVLLSDDFTGTDGDFIDTRLWRVPDGGDGASYGQTTVKTDQNLTPTIGGNAGVLQLETFLPDNTPGDPGNRFYGAEFQSRSSFALGGGLRWEARLKLGSSLDGGTTSGGAPILAPPSGVVGGAFLFDVVNPGDVTLVRDELDFELLSKQSTSIFTNLYNDEGFTGPAGDGLLTPNPVGGYSPYNYHDYKIEWTPGKVEYFIDNVSIRTETNPSNTHVPDDPMTAHFNLWGPDSGFSDAFDPNFVPVGTSAENTVYTMSVDQVDITRFNTISGPEKVVNGSFEDPLGPEWFNVFNNASMSSEAGGANGGAGGPGFALKLFDPGNPMFDASGAQQRIPVTPGDEVSASVFGFMPSGDSIAPDPNTNPTGDRFTQMVLSFLDGGNAVIEERLVTMFDSRDPNINDLTDEWIKYTNEWIAPANTVNAQISLFFISDEGSGAVFMDDVSLVNLSASVPDDADFDNSGIVDGLDFLLWQRGETPEGGSAAELTLWETQYGGPPPLSANIASVPEPSTIAICGLMTTMLVGIRRRQRTC